MIKDQQARLLMRHVRVGDTVAAAGAKAGMSESSAKKYRRLGKPPSACQQEHTWRTRQDPFSEVWEEVQELLKNSPGLQAITVMEELQRRYPGAFQDGQLRTLQRKMKVWRVLKGPDREVYFLQKHHPGVLCASDYCHMSSLGITIEGQSFPHMLYHFVLTYSNWESATVCFSESAESLSEGLQNALWEVGGVPQRHLTDSLSAAVKPPGRKDEFTQSYEALLAHYGLRGEHTQPTHPNENGDIEQRHYRTRERLEQALLLRGSREFASRAEYDHFLQEQIRKANKGRKVRLEEEQKELRPLPAQRREACQKLRVRVSSGSTIRAKHITYSVPSRLIGEEVEVRVYAERLEVWYAQRKVEEMPRQRGGYHHAQHSINYRHIIEWLVRKPGAFMQYRYQDSLFPSSQFRMAYDALLRTRGSKEAVREYLKILELSARESEEGVQEALRHLMQSEEAPTAGAVLELLQCKEKIMLPTQVGVDEVNLEIYDSLLESPLALESPLEAETREAAHAWG